MPSKKILLVDHSSTALMLAQLIQKSTSYDLCVLSEAEGLLAGVRAARPDLILVDSTTLHGPAAETCKGLRAEPTTSAVPIILVTTRREAASDRRAELDCDDVIIKPVSAIELLSKLRAHLGE